MEQFDFVNKDSKNRNGRKPSSSRQAGHSGPREGHKRLTADIPEDLHKRLKLQALMEDGTVTEIIIKATRAWLATRKG